MSRTSRRMQKRRLAQSLHAVETSYNYIYQMYELYDDGQHEDYVALLTAIFEIHAVLKEYIEKFWEHAFGHLPDNPDEFRRGQ